MNSPLIGASTPLLITLENWGRLTALAAAKRTLWLLNGAADVLSMMHCTVGWPTTWPLLS